MRPTILWGALLLSVAVTGCTVESGPYAESPPVYTEPTPVYTEPAPAYSEPAPAYTEPTYDPEPVVFEEPPPLVSIEPDVYVVYNYPVPVYYVGGFYWRFHSGLWYRAPDYNASWVSVNAGVVPRTIIHRNHHHYARYAPARAHIIRAPTRYHATTPRYTPPSRSYRSTAPTYRSPTYRSTAPTYRSPTYRSTAPTYRTRPVAPAPHRQVVPPGHVQQRSVPVRRPNYNEPIQRQRVRGRDVPAPPRVVTPPRPPVRPQPPVQPRRDDRRRGPPNRGDTTHDHPHTHSQERTHHH
ncbi:MAG TPA: hypothetical protein VFB62_23895 [Polyangiaceae bacterium]|nr:hypothetical protein [Polyangiaceae bacterium]